MGTNQPGDFASAMAALRDRPDDRASFARPFVTCFPVTGAAVSTIGTLLGSETVAASDRLAERLDEIQFDLGEGPCWDAMTSSHPVLVPDVLRGTRWPAFSRAIGDEGIRSIFAFPLNLGPLRIGAVDLYADSPVELDEDQARQATEMAGLVGRNILRLALAGTNREYADDPANRYSRRTIHQATGMVLAQLDISAEDAGLVLEGHAFATNRSMMLVAEEVIAGRLNFSNAIDGIEESS